MALRGASSASLAALADSIDARGMGSSDASSLLDSTRRLLAEGQGQPRSHLDAAATLAGTIALNCSNEVAKKELDATATALTRVLEGDRSSTAAATASASVLQRASQIGTKPQCSSRLGAALLDAARGYGTPEHYRALARAILAAPSCLRSRALEVATACCDALQDCPGDSELRRSALNAVAAAPLAGSSEGAWEEQAMSLLRGANRSIEGSLGPVEEKGLAEEVARALYGGSTGELPQGCSDDQRSPHGDSAASLVAAFDALEASLARGEATGPVRVPVRAISATLWRLARAPPVEPGAFCAWYHGVRRGFRLPQAALEAGGMAVEQAAPLLIKPLGACLAEVGDACPHVRASLHRAVAEMLRRMSPPAASVATHSLAPYPLADVHAFMRGDDAPLHGNNSKKTLTRVDDTTPGDSARRKDVVLGACECLAAIATACLGTIPQGLRTRVEDATARLNEFVETTGSELHIRIAALDALVHCVCAFDSAKSRYLALALGLLRRGATERGQLRQFCSERLHLVTAATHPGAEPIAVEPSHGSSLREEHPGQPWPDPPPDFTGSMAQGRNEAHAGAHLWGGKDHHGGSPVWAAPSPSAARAEGEEEAQRGAKRPFRNDKRQRDPLEDEDDTGVNATRRLVGRIQGPRESEEGTEKERHVSKVSRKDVPSAEELYGIPDASRAVAAEKAREVALREHAAKNALSDVRLIKEPLNHGKNDDNQSSADHQRAERKQSSPPEEEEEAEDSDGPLPEIVI